MDWKWRFENIWAKRVWNKKERRKRKKEKIARVVSNAPSSWKNTAKRKNAYHTKFMTDLKLSKEYNIYLAIKKEREREGGKREIYNSSSSLRNVSHPPLAETQQLSTEYSFTTGMTDIYSKTNIFPEHNRGSRSSFNKKLPTLERCSELLEATPSKPAPKFVPRRMELDLPVSTTRKSPRTLHRSFSSCNRDDFLYYTHRGPKLHADFHPPIVFQAYHFTTTPCETCCTIFFFFFFLSFYRTLTKTREIPTFRIVTFQVEF